MRVCESQSQKEIPNIIKKYHNRPVLNHVSLSFDKGSSVAFVGHNGCGKSTLLKCIAGLIAPDAGKVVYAMPLLFHYIPEKFPPTVLTAREYLMRMGEMSGIRREEAEQSIAALGKDFFMEELLDTPMNVLSKGTLQKVGVIQALLKRPDVQEISVLKWITWVLPPVNNVMGSYGHAEFFTFSQTFKIFYF